ncbi:MAG: hypothetical protein WC319_11600 [Candidatus Paceibacterota bacterium]|jgi:hypothetical protein
MKKTFTFIFICLFIFPLFIFAMESNIAFPHPATPPVGLIILDWIIGIAMILAPLVIIYGGLKYMLARGDKKKISQAKKVILYGILGLILVLVASFLINIFTMPQF